ncbi:MAG: aldolase/citrate lyase family protein [Victivallaceae bacterium]|nr:aldolase/citrate lyase family protein [Victivallaceae bacterium]
MYFETGKLKARLRSGSPTFFGCVMDCRTGMVMEAYKHAGLDAVMIDREHTCLDRINVLELVRAARLSQLPCMIRASQLAYAEINPLLDQLPDGIFVPRIRSRADVEELMRIVKYPPHGQRGCGASTCPAGKYIGWKGGPYEMTSTLNRDTVVGIQIETKEAFESLDDILSVPGLDVAVVGNDDLSVGLGIPGQFQSQTYQNAVRKIIAACRKHAVIPGIAGGDPEWVRFWLREGMKVFWVCDDPGLLWHGAKHTVDSLHQVLEEEHVKR